MSLGHELSSLELGQDDDKTYSPWVSIAETLSHAGARNVAETQRTVVSYNPFGSG